MKAYALVIMFVISVGMVIAAPVKITVDGEAYGHHGNCYGWNNCGSAEACALAACQANGFDTLVSKGEAKPCTEFTNCNLFSDVSSLIVDCEWGNSCEVMGITDIWCDNGSYVGECSIDLPSQIGEPGNGGSNEESNDEPNPEVPEFGVFAAGAALIGALGIFAFTRRK